ncbi:pickpocket protein 28 isoform X4 [Plutella xylostella]|uniref:pickpocket protein 28 isoform X4 n=1 Tax=Plutella xylostella TaxID=51655 RepID=UPI002032B915|nr:pickpocket protein 28 isoform X4 [Plutella xylostella]
MVPTQERVRPCGCLPACSGAAARKDLREYLLTSTLHGLRYIGEGRLTWFERVFWLLAFAFSLICASFFILNIYDKWRSAPMIVSINPRSLLLADLPFPAVTICNVNQAKKSVAHRYKETGSSKDKKLLQSLCTSNNDTAIFDNSTDNADWEYFRAFLINVTQPCSEMLDQCYWNDERQDCQDLFNAQLTDEGLCCTFNVVHRDMMFRNPKDLYDLNLTFPLPAVDWTPEGGYPPDSPESGFPWRPLGTGTHHGLTLVLDTNIDEYYCGSTSSPGFKILLHNPTETPKIAAYGDIYGPGAEARVAVTPRILDAQPQLQAIDRAQRLCVFSSERNLTFYRTYTQRNCEMECEAETMLNTCQCVQYFMPKNRSTRVCGKADAECYSGRTLPGNREESSGGGCGCLPACTEISYSERRSSAPLSNTLIEQNRYIGEETPDYFNEHGRSPRAVHGVQHDELHRAHLLPDAEGSVRHHQEEAQATTLPYLNSSLHILH